MIKASVVVFECEHSLQKRGLAFYDPPRQLRHEHQQRLLSRTLTDLFKQYAFSFVGEELGYGDDGLVRQIAQAFQCYYFKIEMPLKKRDGLGCSGGYANEIAATDFPTREEWQANVKRCHSLREAYMEERIVEFLADGESGLAVCGIEHGRPLADRLKTCVAEVIKVSIMSVPGFDRYLYGFE